MKVKAAVVRAEPKYHRVERVLELSLELVDDDDRKQAATLLAYLTAGEASIALVLPWLPLKEGKAVAPVKGKGKPKATRKQKETVQ